MTKKRIFSGAQPTGQLHIGNYLGALKNWVALQDEYESFYCIVNLHAITLPQDPATLRKATLDLARIYLAAGVDPEKATIFIQSDVPEHAELTWVLSCIARMGELERMTQFKDKARIKTENIDRVIAEYNLTVAVDRHEKGSDLPAESAIKIAESIAQLKQTRSTAGVGLFTYPILMAADILLYQTDLVPVGQDQKQHLELSRDLAERFNRDFGGTFKVPEPFIPKAGASIKSIQDPSKKMSKSDENVNGSIFLLDDADTITKKIKRAVTDSGTEITFDETRPAIANLLTIYQLLTGKTSEECVAHFDGKGYGQFKGELAEATVEFLRPFQERVNHYSDEDFAVILKKGADKARSIAAATLADVYQKTGIR
ncbi:MAG: tryptophan--tRNA ligase [Pyrinomonadaceae bacterium]|nr:tryptophan--tRNA ligase [Acidobacteriota bacterium]MBP7377166.1 tryptophan--tRNA ligase [Pyrinomonadaceae bacterium]MBP7476136.1 tryptophan--tRNA ligase [Pyrinomonadaceae bacterium]